MFVCTQFIYTKKEENMKKQVDFYLRLAIRQTTNHSSVDNLKHKTFDNSSTFKYHILITGCDFTDFIF